jgi:hypothetical protein
MLALRDDARRDLRLESAGSERASSSFKEVKLNTIYQK